MLAALRLSGAAAGVHEKQRRFGIHRNRRHDRSGVLGSIKSTQTSRSFTKGVAEAFLPGAAARRGPFHYMAFLLGSFQRDICARFVVQHFTVAIAAIDGDQDVASRIGGVQCRTPRR